MKFKNLKLGGKLAIGFGFFILILLVASISEFVSLKGIEKKNRTAIKSYDLAGAFLESKNHVLQDMQILMKIMESNSNDQLDKLDEYACDNQVRFRKYTCKG